jgi:hypothetical protein
VQAKARRRRVVRLRVDDRTVRIALEQHDVLDCRLGLADRVAVSAAEDGRAAQPGEQLAREQRRGDGPQAEADIDEIVA